jgi:hypothetical protein
VTVTVKLQNYASITSTLASFTLEIIGCIVTGFSMVNLSPSNDKSYTVSDSTPLTWSLDATSIITTQVPACGYAETLTTSQLPDFINVPSSAALSFSV